MYVSVTMVGCSQISRWLLDRFENGLQIRNQRSTAHVVYEGNFEFPILNFNLQWKTLVGCKWGAPWPLIMPRGVSHMEAVREAVKVSPITVEDFSLGATLVIVVPRVHLSNLRERPDGWVDQRQHDNGNITMREIERTGEIWVTGENTDEKKRKKRTRREIQRDRIT